MRKSLALALALAFGATACTEENPTEVGDALLPSGDVLTFEVILPASAFLVYDTSFAGFNIPLVSPFGVVARSFESVFDANTLVRFSLPPRTLSVRTTGTTVVVDSSPRYSTGRMLIRLDTLTNSALPVRLALYRTAEEWDVTATWENRVDSLTRK